MSFVRQTMLAHNKTVVSQSQKIYLLSEYPVYNKDSGCRKDVSD